MNIEHDPMGQKFATEADGEECFLAYTEINGNLNIHFMSVPDGPAGDDVAEALVSAAFEYAEANGVKIISSSDYVNKTFLKNHPELEQLVDREW